MSFWSSIAIRLSAAWLSRQQHIRMDASHAQNTTLKLKAVPFVPSFQKVEKDVWTDNGVRTVRESLSVYQNTA